MKIGWTDERCILCCMMLCERQARCTDTAELTNEHLIPEAIGGRLTCNFLCKHCNSTLGQIEAKLRKNSRIQLAVNNLKHSLPDLWATIFENQPCIGKNESGESVAGRIKNRTFSVDSVKRPDGSLIHPLDKGAGAIRTMLQKSGALRDEILITEENFKQLPDNIRVRIANGIEVVKSTVDSVYPVLNSQEIERSALIKIAYEYLALHLGIAIFHSYFDPIRAFLKGGEFPASCSVTPKRARDRTYQPFHGLAVRRMTNGLVVKIRLFGYLSYPVEFYGLQIASGTTCSYMARLDTRREEWI